MILIPVSGSDTTAEQDLLPCELELLFWKSGKAIHAAGDPEEPCSGSHVDSFDAQIPVLKEMV